MDLDSFRREYEQNGPSEDLVIRISSAKFEAIDLRYDHAKKDVYFCELLDAANDLQDTICADLYGWKIEYARKGVETYRVGQTCGDLFLAAISWNAESEYCKLTWKPLKQCGDSSIGD